MRGLIHIGENNYSGGRAGDPPSVGLSASLIKHGVQLGRLKTGTPPRVHRRSIDFTETEEQPGEPGIKFSYDDEGIPRIPQISCHITYTSAQTKEVILKNIHRSPMYSGKIVGVGPRYCPSIEDKIVRFADKERHQIFLEPEGLYTDEIYVNGVSSSLPFDVQLEYIRSIVGLKNAEIMRPAYAIEYDYVTSGQIDFSLACKSLPGLYLAGQVNGTTGYEEAAGQGIVAGINAANYVSGRAPFILKRSDAYIGVMIDDLVTKGIDEPYRMFTSRAEHRLLLRQDNADLRLRKFGYDHGIVDQKRYDKLCHKQKTLEEERTRLAGIYKQLGGKGYTLAQLMCRPENSYQALMEQYPDQIKDHGDDINFQIELNIKYEGYISRQESEIAKLSHVENIKVPVNFDYTHISGLRNEAKQKLGKVRPSNLGQASRISGVSPSDISVLMIALMKQDVSPPQCSV
jgi:tRNA uridine 5-carboxymethylaminomethyl modification enzyme